MTPVRAAAILSLVLAITFAGAHLTLAQQTAGGLFPSPFLVEHHIEQRDGDGGLFTGDTVVDHYGGSWIVSERPDGSRMVVDFDRRELTEVWMQRGSYAVLSFGRFAELQRRLRVAEGVNEQAPAEAASAGLRSAKEPRFRFTEPGKQRRSSGDLSTARAKSADRVLHLEVRLEAAEEDAPPVEVWLDPAVRLSTAARHALESFEQEVLAVASTGAVPHSRYIAAARERAGGAFPVRTRRPLDVAGATSEDVVTRLEPVPIFPAELVAIPEGFQRVAHPLESVVAFMEEEAEYAERTRRALEGGD